MTLNKRRLCKTLIAGGVFFSVQAMALDIPVNITGIIQIPPCQINDGKTIVVDFGDIPAEDIDNERNHRKVIIPVKCSYVQGAAYVKVTGKSLGTNTNVLSTNIANFGIALYQGDGTSSKLMLGDGEFNGLESIGHPIRNGLSGGKENETFTFTAVPYKEGRGNIESGDFTASASISISYF
ncbi:fimbrial protein [Escherichia coli]|uniref:Fimbrial protein n=3 Tax=Escherichia coli TaxID=562 RepID=A0A6D0HJJ4_ECOLX|nr:fimbrial protein [Escherichia coli]KAE9728699.1 fimbrial protein [Escherichia coli]KAE9729748.1 fimbrial protein [Escherichia coli]MVV61126.1 fimbrial protein [Escherichia coli]MVV70511.1 fimbrial protein [Escherichia coli]MWN41773.1 fimbrial protein [Escherichia coli]